MNGFKRVVCLVADGFGVGEAPDAALYGDEGANTLGHIAETVGNLRLPELEKLGIGNLGNFSGIAKTTTPLGSFGRMAEKSSGKDTTTGHWELAGLVTEKPFAVFERFSDDLLEAFVREAKLPGILGNVAASGTAIIEQLGEQSVSTGKPIVYTSADSVFQIAAHETAFGLSRLYEVCEVARRLTLPLQIGRVIARPFVGNNASDFSRTENRRDYALSPPRHALDALIEAGVQVCGVGKIEDIFAHRSLTSSRHTGNNKTSLQATFDFLKQSKGREAFIFTNLVDFDMLYGHRRDPKGYARALRELDDFLPTLLGELEPGDALFLTADHGCDPTYPGTDHTREFVPILAYSPSAKGTNLGDRNSFADVAATLCEGYGLKSGMGKSFLHAL